MADLRDAAYASVVDYRDPLTRAARDAWRHGRQERGVYVTRSSVNADAVARNLYGPDATRADKERTRRNLRQWATACEREAQARIATLLTPLHGADVPAGHDTGQTVRYVLDDSRVGHACAAYRWQRQHGRTDLTAPDQWEAWQSEHAAGTDATGARSRWTGNLTLTHAPASCRVPNPRSLTDPSATPYGADAHAWQTYTAGRDAWHRGDHATALALAGALTARQWTDEQLQADADAWRTASGTALTL